MQDSVGDDCNIVFGISAVLQKRLAKCLPGAIDRGPHTIWKLKGLGELTGESWIALLNRVHTI